MKNNKYSIRINGTLKLFFLWIIIVFINILIDTKSNIGLLERFSNEIQDTLYILYLIIISSIFLFRSIEFYESYFIVKYFFIFSKKIIYKDVEKITVIRLGYKHNGGLNNLKIKGIKKSCRIFIEYINNYDLLLEDLYEKTGIEIEVPKSLLE